MPAPDYSFESEVWPAGSSCAGLRDDSNFKIGVADIAWDIDSDLPCLQNVLPASSRCVDREVVHIRLRRKSWWWHLHIRQLQSWERPLHKLTYSLSRAEFDDLRHQADDCRIAHIRTHTQYPSRSPQTTFVVDRSRMDVHLRFLEIERNRIRWNDDLKVSANMFVEFPKDK